MCVYRADDKQTKERQLCDGPVSFWNVYTPRENPFAICIRAAPARVFSSFLRFLFGADEIYKDGMMYSIARLSLLLYITTEPDYMNARPRDPAERETQWTLLYLWPLLHRRSSRQNRE